MNNSTFRRTVAALESDDLYFDVAWASTAEGLLLALRSHTITHSLREHMLRSPDNIDRVVDYAFDLLQDASSTSGAFGREIALCACLIVLSQTGDSRAEQLFRAVQRRRPSSLMWTLDLLEECGSTAVNYSLMRCRPMVFEPVRETPLRIIPLHDVADRTQERVYRYGSQGLEPACA